MTEEEGLRELEASGYWESGYVDSVTGEVREFDHKQDWDDAYNRVLEEVANDLWEDAGTLPQQDGARAILNHAEDGEQIELDLGHRHYFVREVGAKQSDDYDFGPKQHHGLTP